MGALDQLSLSFTEIAVIWILHHGTSSAAKRSLTSEIVEFYPVALKAMSRADSLRGAKQSDLRLIYFKGLVVAKTHSTLQMIDAIKRAERVLARSSPSVEHSEAAPSADQDTLAHIADALGRSAESSH